MQKVAGKNFKLLVYRVSNSLDYLACDYCKGNFLFSQETALYSII